MLQQMMGGGDGQPIKFEVVLEGDGQVDEVGLTSLFEQLRVAAAATTKTTAMGRRMTRSFRRRVTRVCSRVRVRLLLCG